MTGAQALFYVHTLNPFAVRITDSFGIRWYGLSYLAGFLVSYFIIRQLSRRSLTPLKLELVGDFIFTVALGTIIGGRLGYCLLYSPELFVRFSSSAPFWGVLAINEGGMASHGGILGILLASLLFARRHSLSGLHLADLTTLGGGIGIFFGRLANFVNGELVGRAAPANLPWGVKFPQDIFLWPSHEPGRLQDLSPAVVALGSSAEKWNENLAHYQFDLGAWRFVEETLHNIVAAVQNGNLAVTEKLAAVLTVRHPSQLYEALLEGLLLFLIIVFIWRKPRKPGVVTGSFFVFYSLVRIVGEQFRQPDVQIGYQMWGLTRGQWLSFGLLAFGLVFVALCARRKVVPLGGWDKRA